jgi:hypothetical protein
MAAPAVARTDMALTALNSRLGGRVMMDSTRLAIHTDEQSRLPKVIEQPVDHLAWPVLWMS